MSNISTLIALKSGVFPNTISHNSDSVAFVQSRTQWLRTIWTGWHSVYTGTATARKNATLHNLAYLITGNEDDWKELNAKETIQSGQKIKIEPLLQKLELNIRANVVAATKNFKAEFSSEVAFLADATPSQRVNAYFDGSKNLKCDCMTAAAAVLEKGLLDTIGENLFNRLGKRNLPYVEVMSKQLLIENMFSGDRAQFPNHNDWRNFYPEGEDWLWNGENVIKVGENRFWGHIGDPTNSVKTKMEWEKSLNEEFNNLEKVREMINAKKMIERQSIAGFSKPVDVFFIDVAAIAMQLFDLRMKGFK
jgi:Protein-glutamine gamma-glutamyltransferase